MEIEYKAFKLDVTPQKIAQLIDHTKLSPWEGPDKIESLCKEAIQHHFYSVCVNSCHIPLAVRILEGTDIKICSVVGFPLGTMDSESKACETKKVVQEGAHEVDMVINVGMLKNEEDRYVQADIEAVVSAADKALVKVIIETCYLTDEEKIKACELAKDAGAHFVKTSTGFGINIINNLKWMTLSNDWSIDEIPCRLCPVRAAAFGKMSENHYSYLKEKCHICQFKEYNTFYD